MIFLCLCCIQFYFLSVTTDNSVGLQSGPRIGRARRDRRTRQNPPDGEVAGLIGDLPVRCALGGHTCPNLKL